MAVRMRYGVLAVLLLALLASVACGDGGDSDPTPAPTNPASTATATATAVLGEGAQESLLAEHGRTLLATLVPLADTSAPCTGLCNRSDFAGTVKQAMNACTKVLDAKWTAINGRSLSDPHLRLLTVLLSGCGRLKTAQSGTEAAQMTLIKEIAPQISEAMAKLK